PTNVARRADFSRAITILLAKVTHSVLHKNCTGPHIRRIAMRRIGRAAARATGPLLGAFFVVLAAGRAGATPISVTGAVDPISAPADARLNTVLESNTLAPLFTEVMGFFLPGNLTVDFNAPGTYNANPVSTSTIAAGTRVDSYYLVTDPIGSD